MLAIHGLFLKYLYIYILVKLGKDALLLFTWSKWSLVKVQRLLKRLSKK